MGKQGVGTKVPDARTQSMLADVLYKGGEQAHLRQAAGDPQGPRVPHDQAPGVQGVAAHPFRHIVPVEAQVGQYDRIVLLCTLPGCQAEGSCRHTGRIPHLPMHSSGPRSSGMPLCRSGCMKRRIMQCLALTMRR